MPVYDYGCTKCKKRKEIKMKFTEYEESKTTGVVCPDCGTSLVRLVSKPFVIFKGDGWFPSRSDMYDSQMHGLSRREMDENLEMEHRLEGEMYEGMAKGENNYEGE